MNSLTLENHSLRVTVNPQVGGTITTVYHRPTGLSVLGTVPWESIRTPLPNPAAHDEPEWLTRYSGGWALLFPNGGDACTVDGIFHGFHGEASVTPWEITKMADGELNLTRRFATVPATMHRKISLEGEKVAVKEELSYLGSQSMDVMWCHHPTFGSDLLATPFEVTCGARHVAAETHFDPSTSPIVPGAAGAWPTLSGKAGRSVDLGHPRSPWASVAYLSDFDAPWAAIRRLDDAIAVLLTWDGTRFPCAWLWYELAATQDAPWNGSTHLIGIEPSTTPCALGLSNAMARDAQLLRLEPGAAISAAISLHVFTPSGPILNGFRDLPPQNTDQRAKSS